VRLLQAATLVLLASCVTTPEPPRPSPAGDIGLGRFLDVRDFSVKFDAFSEEAAAKAALLEKELPAAWSAATDGQSRLRVVDRDEDIRIVVLDALGTSTGGGRLITLRLPGPGLPPSHIALALHEIGHSLGCCFGAESGPDGHWTACVRGAEIMCHGGPVLTAKFSERELRALRLR
jgi:hypothetical protein